MYYSNDNVLTFNNKMKNYVMENFLNAKGDFSKTEKVDGPKTKREKQKLQRENPINLRNFLAYRFDQLKSFKVQSSSRVRFTSHVQAYILYNRLYIYPISRWHDLPRKALHAEYNKNVTERTSRYLIYQKVRYQTIQ